MTLQPPFAPPPVAPHPGVVVRVVGTNALATTSLVTALLGLSLVAVVCGHVARRQIRRTGEGGDAQAVVGLVVGYLGLAATALGVTLVVGAVTLPFVAG